MRYAQRRFDIEFEVFSVHNVSLYETLRYVRESSAWERHSDKPNAIQVARAQ